MTELGRNWEREELPGGMFRQVIHVKPIAFERGGIMRRMGNLVGQTGDQDLTLGVDELLQFRVRPRLVANRPIVHIGHQEHYVRFAPLGTNNVDGQVAGNRILYPGAWAGADLALTVGGHIIRKEIMLSAGHPRAFRFAIHETLAGEGELVNGVYRIGKLLMPAPYLERGLEVVPLTWKLRQENGRAVLRVDLPAGDWSGWTLDPTTTIQPDAAAGQDSYLQSDTATTNRGTQTNLIVGDASTGVSNAIRSVIKFDLTSLPITTIVTSAVLSLYEWTAADEAGTGSWSVALRRVLRNWVEAQCTWNIYSTGNNWTTAGCGSDGNDRAAGNSASVTMDGTAAGAFVDWAGATLTSDVQNFVSGTYNNYGWLWIAPTAEYLGTSPRSANYVYSSDYATDAAKRPKIVINSMEGLTGAVSLAGVVSRLIGAGRAGAVTSAGVTVKLTGKVTAGELTWSSVLGAVWSGGGTTYDQAVDGVLTLAGALARQVARTLAGAQGLSGAAVKETNKVVSGEQTLSGTANKGMGWVMSGAVGLAGDVAKAAALVLVGSVGLAGQVYRGVGKVVAGAVTMSGEINRYMSKVLVGAVGSGGALVKSVGKVVSGAVTWAGTVIRLFGRSLAGTLGPTGGLSFVYKGLVAVSKALVGLVSTAKALVGGAATSKTAANASVSDTPVDGAAASESGVGGVSVRDD